MTDAIDFMERNKEHDFIGFYDFEIDKVRRNLDWIRTERDKQSPQHFVTQMRNLKMFTNQHDVRRGTDFNSIFPELTTVYLELSSLYTDLSKIISKNKLIAVFFPEPGFP
jgi:hypothetical protein